MSSNAGRVLMLLGVAVALFGISIIVLTNLLPGPHTKSDYLIIGCLSTLISMFVLFVILISTSLKTPNPFFKRRKR